MNEEDLKNFYKKYENYTQKNNVFNFQSRKEKSDSIPVKLRVSFDLKPSEEFIEKMEYRLLKVQEALDDLRDELYLYSDD